MGNLNWGVVYTTHFVSVLTYTNRGTHNGNRQKENPLKHQSMSAHGKPSLAEPCSLSPPASRAPVLLSGSKGSGAFFSMQSCFGFPVRSSGRAQRPWPLQQFSKTFVQLQKSRMPNKLLLASQQWETCSENVVVLPKAFLKAQKSSSLIFKVPCERFHLLCFS